MNRLLILFVLIALSAFCTLADPTVQNAPKKSWISNLKDRLFTGFLKPESGKPTVPESTNTVKVSKPTLSNEETQAHIKAAEDYIQGNDIDKALNELYIVLQSDPNHEYGCTLTGILLLSMKEFTGAEDFLYNAVTLSKWTNINAIYHLALLYSTQKDYDLSIRVLIKGMNVTNSLSTASTGPDRVPVPDNAYLFTYGLAETYYTIQNYNLSAQYYYLTAQQRVQEIDLWLKASTFYFPVTKDHKKDYDYMERILLQAIQVNPNQPVLLYHLGVVLHSTDRIAQAIVLYEEAIRLRNDFPEAMAALATAYHAQLRYTDALASYNIAYQKNPENIVLLCNFAQLLYTLQRSQDGDLLLQQAVALNPNHPEVLATVQKLKQGNGNVNNTKEKVV